jgi:hypothetical protein
MLMVKTKGLEISLVGCGGQLTISLFKMKGV